MMRQWCNSTNSYKDGRLVFPPKHGAAGHWFHASLCKRKGGVCLNVVTRFFGMTRHRSDNCVRWRRVYAPTNPVDVRALRWYIPTWLVIPVRRNTEASSRNAVILNVTYFEINTYNFVMKIRYLQSSTWTERNGINIAFLGTIGPEKISRKAW